MKRLLITASLASFAAAVDDMTMSFIANVDPIPVTVEKKPTSLLEGAKATPVSDESYMAITGIQLMNKRLQMPAAVAAPAPRRFAPVALHDGPSGGSTGRLVPDVLICALPAKSNSISVRACDLIRSSKAVLSQVLKCTPRLYAGTVKDLLMGAQSAPVDFRAPTDVISSINSQERRSTVELTFGACDDPRSSLPDLDVTKDYVAFVILNPAVELAAENFALKKSGSKNFKAGVVFSAIGNMNEDVKAEIATGFQTHVEHCMDDGVCTAKEVSEWANSKSVDWLVGRSDAVVRVVGAPRS